MMCVEAARIEYQAPPSFRVQTRVCIPEISVNERRFDGSTPSLERPQQTRNDAIKDDRQQLVHFGVCPFGLDL